jgi:hypothetical protein
VTPADADADRGDAPAHPRAAFVPSVRCRLAIQSGRLLWVLDMLGTWIPACPGARGRALRMDPESWWIFGA